MDIVTLSMAKAYSDKQRLAYTARAIDPVTGESKILLEPNDDFGGLACAFERYTITKFDEKYNPIAIVIWNGVEYWCKPFIGVETIIIGNSHLCNPDAEDTGEPFLLMQTHELNDGHVTWFSNTTGLVTVRINYEHDIIHPIDPKYLPGVCLPVVELSTVVTDEGAALTAEESARMDEVAAMGVPIVCSCKIMIGGQLVPLSINTCTMAGMYAALVSASYALRIVKNENNWEIRLEMVE